MTKRMLLLRHASHYNQPDLFLTTSCTCKFEMRHQCNFSFPGKTCASIS